MAEEDDPFSSDYGEIPLVEQQSKTVCDVKDWCDVKNLDTSLEGRLVKIRGSLFKSRNMSKMSFLHIRQDTYTVQCVVNKDNVSSQMMKFVKSLSPESIVNVEGIVRNLPAPTLCTQQVEITVQKLHCLSNSERLPFNLEHAAAKLDNDPVTQK
ncbi:aspartate-tRNA ligase cytoplasmic-like, partial [Trifolium medium]|nr:aspartate-tRNA ligase cytoplasmic-like [Trifolium medium]